MTDLEKLRDELAEKDMNSTYVNLGRSFHRGWDARDKALTEAAGEFDEKAYIAEYERRYAIGIDECHHLKMARWQFEQDRARIGLAEELEKSSYQQCIDNADAIEQLEGKLASTNDYVKMTEARLAESEQQRKVCVCCRRDLDEGAGKSFPSTHAFNSLQDKLTAAEAMVKGLEQEIRKLRYTIERQALDKL